MVAVFLSDIETDGDLWSFCDLADKAASKLIDTNGKAMCSSTGGVDIKMVENIAGLTEYCTKELDEHVSESGCDHPITLAYVSKVGPHMGASILS